LNEPFENLIEKLDLIYLIKRFKPIIFLLISFFIASFHEKSFSFLFDE